MATLDLVKNLMCFS